MNRDFKALSVFVGTAVLLGLSSSGHGGVVRTWIGNSGQYGNPFNWSGFAVPTSTEFVVFSDSDAVDRTVTFLFDRAVSGALIEDGRFFFDIEDVEWSMPNALTIGDGFSNPSLYLRDGLTSADFLDLQSGFVYVTSDAALVLDGDINLDGSGQQTLWLMGDITAGSAYVGSSGANFPSVLQYGDVEMIGSLSFVLGVSNSAAWDVWFGGVLEVVPNTIVDSGSELRARDVNSTISLNGLMIQSGRVELDLGSIGTSGQTEINASSGGVGHLDVMEGSLWTVRDSLFVGGDELGADGDGSVTVATDGAVEVEGVTTLLAPGEITIAADGTFRTAWMSNVGGDLNWQPGGTLHLTQQWVSPGDDGLFPTFTAVYGPTLRTPGMDVYLSGAAVDVWGGELHVDGVAYLGRYESEEGELTLDSSLASFGTSLNVGGTEFGPGGTGFVNHWNTAETVIGGTLRVWNEGTWDHVSGSVKCADFHSSGGFFNQAGGQVLVSNSSTGFLNSGFIVNGSPIVTALVEDGAAHFTSSALIGNSGRGEKIVRGGSYWENFGGLIVGTGTEGILELEDSELFSFGDVIVGPNGTFKIADSTVNAPFVDNSGYLQARGTINAFVNNYAGGTLAPGLSPGLLTIASNEAGLSLRAGGTVEIELGGLSPVDYDRIEVDGPVDVAGTLHVSAISGFSPMPGQIFEVIRSIAPLDMGGGVFGQFDAIEPADQYDVIYTPSAVLIEVLEPGCPEDFDGSGHVGFDDLQTLLQNWGPCVAPPCPGDVDDSGHVGFDDLQGLLQAWGECG